jgi:AcrR family transcriptional regulator
MSATASSTAPAAATTTAATAPAAATTTAAATTAATAAATQLPRGRHGLTREQVLSSQRGRILAAIAEAVAQRGFARTTVADVIARAGVSRETFYEQFRDKEDCFLAALDGGAEALLALLGETLADASADTPADGDPLHKLDRVLAAYLDALAAEPRFAKAFLIDAFGAGERAIRRRIELQTRFVELVEQLTGDRVDRFGCEAIVAALSSMATVRVGSGRAAELPELRGPMIEFARRLWS